MITPTTMNLYADTMIYPIPIPNPTLGTISFGEAMNIIPTPTTRNAPTMKIHPFPHCCGSWIITGFGYNYTKADKERITKELNTYVLNYDKTAILMLILNERQNMNFKETVEACGFKQASTGWNYNEGDENVLYCINNNNRDECAEDEDFEDDYEYDEDDGW